MATSDTESVLADLVSHLPGGGEARPGQVRMAAAVADAVASGEHLVVEAGTGTGKTLAYLVPTILAGDRVVVATATKALQDQLATKDLPFLESHLDEPFAWAVLKGRSNYLCRQKLGEVAEGTQLELGDGDVPSGSIGEQVVRLRDWAETTVSGDRAELDFEPSPLAWGQVSVTPTECPGADNCPSGGSCFAEDARAAARAATVVVVNLHLYALHLAADGGILPEHDVVVIDEAHQLEEIVSQAAGLEIGPGRFSALDRMARGSVDDAEAAADVGDLAADWRDALTDRLGDRVRRVDGLLASSSELARGRLETLAGALGSAADDDAGDDSVAARVRARVANGHLRGDLDLVLSLPDGHVVWVEGDDRFPTLKMAPLDVGEFLADRLWGDTTAVLTSATLPASLPDRLGLPEGGHQRVDVESPFDYDAAGLLYCALHLPEPRAPGFVEAAADELVDLVRAAGGRTLGLFTSWRALDVAAERLRTVLDVQVLTQRDLPKPALIEEFLADETSVLLATMGFWQGVDLPGDALRLVAIDKIPFPRPDDPLLQARRERARGDAFVSVDLPRAAILLAQGAGRLIRSTTDRGVVAVLDRRLGTANYRWELVNALPPLRRTRSRDEVLAFLRSLDGSDDG